MSTEAALHDALSLAADYVSDADLRAISAPETGIRGRAATGTTTDHFGRWAEVWDLLAERAPHAFQWHPGRLADPAAPFSLAFLHARRHDAVSPLSGTASLNAALDDARRLLRQATGLSALSAPCRHWVYDADCLQLRHAGALLGTGGLVAFSYAEEPRLRRQVCLDGRYLRQHECDAEGVVMLAALLAHEELHAALAGASRPRSQTSTQSLALALEEGVVATLELAVSEQLITSRPATVGDIRAQLSGYGYGRQVRALLAGRPEEQPVLELASSFCHALIPVIRQGGRESQTVRALNELTGRVGDAAFWQRRIAF